MIPLFIYVTVPRRPEVIVSEPDGIDKAEPILHILVRVVEMHNTTESKLNFWGTTGFVNTTVSMGQIT